MNFGDAIETLRSGKSVRRAGWTNGTKLTFFRDGEQPMIAWGSDHHPAEVYRPNMPEVFAADWEVVP